MIASGQCAGSAVACADLPGGGPGRLLPEAWVGEERICRRDAGELAACFAAHAAGLFGYGCALARGDRALADDLVQAAFEFPKSSPQAVRRWRVLRVAGS